VESGGPRLQFVERPRGCLPAGRGEGRARHESPPNCLNRSGGNRGSYANPREVILSTRASERKCIRREFVEGESSEGLRQNLVLSGAYIEHPSPPPPPEANDAPNRWPADTDLAEARSATPPVLARRVVYLGSEPGRPAPNNPPSKALPALRSA
jgi:hypothetical protein